MKGKLHAIDLFAGAGGLSLGFEQAGFDVNFAIEKDDWAAETYEKNRKNCKVMRSDITEIPDSFFEQYSNIDVVIGGPPCQGFSISASNRRNPDDPRNFLYRHFLRAITIIKPRFVVMENVKEIVKFKLPDGTMLIDDILESLRKLEYHASYGVLNATDYGIPQNRSRFFLIASKQPLSFISNQTEFAAALISNPFHKITLWDAISDLPEVEPGKHREEDIFDYAKQPINDYQHALRAESSKVYNHIPMRHTSRMIERFKLISVESDKSGLPIEHGPRQRGNAETLSGKTYHQNHRRLDPFKPSPTITASFYSSFIHPYQNRNLTVREAARVQTFPDNYRFYGKRTTLSKKLLEKKGIYEDMHLDQFNQVGNAVPPMLARVIAEYILLEIGGSNK